MLTMVCLFLLYFLPALIARNKRDATAILLFNLFLGWTGIGWIIALVWACAAQPLYQLHMIPVAAGGSRFCCQCGSAACAGAHFCTRCGYAV
ncbi:MAG TPA: superinfection immunity protein [Candidatus Acidoferrum sp.]|nr:superinfection immunity protein [Candidatus Acidoferrum sp.]